MQMFIKSDTGKEKKNNGHTGAEVAITRLASSCTLTPHGDTRQVRTHQGRPPVFKDTTPTARGDTYYTIW